jgi:arsenate reductase (thioredoxin)
MTQKKVLILCTGNSARSQMAEALINHNLSADWLAHSAGTEPAGYIHPMALQTLAEDGIQHAGQSKSIEQFRGETFDAVITVCDDAAENCPVWLGQGKKSHISFPDPAKAEGTDEAKMQAFRDVREGIKQRILPFLEEFAA